jgi:heptosyltransferase III
MARRVIQILVVHPGALGDTILAVPVLAALKQTHHPAYLHLIGCPALTDVLPGRSVVDHMSSIEGAEYRALLSGSTAMSSEMTRAFSGFDIAVVWAADPEGAVYSTLSALGIGRVVVRSPGLKNNRPRHATDRFRDTVSALLVGESLPSSGLAATVDDCRIGSRWMADNGIDAGRPTIAVHPGSGSPAKCWPTEYFAEVCTGLIPNGINMIIVEGPADAESVARLRQSLEFKIPVLRGQGLRQVIGVLTQCSVVLGNDSGITQLAASLGIPTVGVFGPTDPAVWGYRIKTFRAIRGSSGCRCLTPTAQQHCQERDCFAVSPGAVQDLLRELVGAAPAGLAT